MTQPTAIAEPRRRVVETHTAVLELDDGLVYKTKKAVDLGFIDLTTVEARRRACKEEVRLNRRLAPEVYLGVEERPGPDGASEPCVVMRRMPDEQRLSRLVAERTDVTAALDSVARQLVHLHQTYPPDPAHDHVGTAEALRQRWHDSSSRLRPLLAGSPLAGVEEDVVRLADEYLDGRSALFDQRIATGHIRDGHGDLRAEDIFVDDDRAVILDCLEFDEDLRWGDVLADIAFLAMDLRFAGRPDLERRLLDRYHELSDDHWPDSLLEHHVAYRAHVRATVEALRAHQAGTDPADAAAGMLALSHDALHRSQIRLIIVGGAPGTGKTTVAAELATMVGAVHLPSDEVRTSVPEAADPDHRYETRAKQAVYDEMRRRTAMLLAEGEHVVADATFSDPRERTLFRATAAAGHAQLDEVWCVVPAVTAARRVASRCQHGAGLSEVSPMKAMEMGADFPHWPEAVVLPTSGTLDETVERARRILAIGRPRATSA